MLNFKVYRTWITGARIYICARNKKDAVKMAKTIDGWKTSHVMSWDPEKRASSESIIIELKGN